MLQSELLCVSERDERARKPFVVRVCAMYEYLLYT